MKITFTVANKSVSPLAQQVVHENRPVRAAVDSVTYELLADNPRFGTITWRLVGDEIAELGHLKQDDKVTWEL